MVLLVYDNHSIAHGHFFGKGNFYVYLLLFLLDLTSKFLFQRRPIGNVKKSINLQMTTPVYQM